MRKIILLSIMFFCLRCNAQRYEINEVFSVLNATTEETVERLCSIVIKGDTAYLNIFDIPAKVEITRKERVRGKTEIVKDNILYRDRICGKVFFFDDSSYVFIGKVNGDRMVMLSIESSDNYIFINTEYLTQNGHFFKR